MKFKGHLISEAYQKLVKSLKMKLVQNFGLVSSSFCRYKGKEKEKENLVKDTNLLLGNSAHWQIMRKSSKISQCWIWTGLTDSAQIWLDQLKIGSKLLGLP